jgi:hypothetical protein
MRNSRRAIAAVACVLALLALPAQAAAPAGSTITTIEHFGSWLGTLWDRFLGLLTEGDPSPLNVDLGGACIDPNGCGQQQ